jgi:hypothetical protein
MNNFIKIYESFDSNPMIGIKKGGTCEDRCFYFGKKSKKFLIKATDGIEIKDDLNCLVYYEFTLDLIKKILESQLEEKDNMQFVIDNCMIKAKERKL